MENKNASGAEKELEALQKEYADFLYTVSHDLSAPIRHISSFSSIILDEHRDKFDEKTKTYFDFIIAGANDLNAMLNGLLQLSRLNTSRQPAVETDLGDVVDAIVRNTLYADGRGFWCARRLGNASRNRGRSGSNKIAVYLFAFKFAEVREPGCYAAYRNHSQGGVRPLGDTLG